MCSPQDLKGGSAEVNAKIMQSILLGEEKGPKRDITLINAGAALYVAGKAESIEDGHEYFTKFETCIIWIPNRLQ